jgi:hypothetical protein
MGRWGISIEVSQPSASSALSSNCHVNGPRSRALGAVVNGTCCVWTFGVLEPDALARAGFVKPDVENRMPWSAPISINLPMKALTISMPTGLLRCLHSAAMVIGSPVTVPVMRMSTS